MRREQKPATPRYETLPRSQKSYSETRSWQRFLDGLEYHCSYGSIWLTLLSSHRYRFSSIAFLIFVVGRQGHFITRYLQNDRDYFQLGAEGVLTYLLTSSKAIFHTVSLRAHFSFRIPKMVMQFRRHRHLNNHC